MHLRDELHSAAALPVEDKLRNDRFPDIPMKVHPKLFQTVGPSQAHDGADLGAAQAEAIGGRPVAGHSPEGSPPRIVHHPARPSGTTCRHAVQRILPFGHREHPVDGDGQGDSRSLHALHLISHQRDQGRDHHRQRTRLLELRQSRNLVVAMLPLNALGNYAFMTGVGPVPAFGPTGTGISSLLVASVSLAILVVVARRASKGASSIPVPASVDWRGLATVLRVGFPIGITMTRAMIPAAVARWWKHKSEALAAQFLLDACARVRFARREGGEIMRGFCVGLEPADRLPPPGRLLMTLGQPVRDKCNHGDQIMGSGRGGRTVGPARGCRMILLLDQHLGADAVDAVE